MWLLPIKPKPRLARVPGMVWRCASFHGPMIAAYGVTPALAYAAWEKKWDADEMLTWHPRPRLGQLLHPGGRAFS